jgi:rod shape-determining protein MreD
MRERENILFVGILCLMVVVQTVVFVRFQPFGMIPDIVLITVAIGGLRLQATPLLIGSFVGGLLLDSLSADALGLRAVVYATAAYVVIATRERADLSPLSVAVWVGMLSVVVVVVFSLVGTVFGQIELPFSQVFKRMLILPFVNTGLCLLAWPVIVRLQTPARRLI